MNCVERLLNNEYSPDEVIGRIVLERQHTDWHISHETIYKYIYSFDMVKSKLKEIDAIDMLIDHIDFNGLTQEDILGQKRLVKTLTTKILSRAMEAEMEHTEKQF